MKTTAEQRALWKRARCWRPDEVIALLDDLDEALAASTHRGEALERVAEAVGYPRGAHYADVLGRIDDLVSEVARLRADLARVSEELGLPPGIGPAPGELQRLLLAADEHARLRAVADAGRAWVAAADAATEAADAFYAGGPIQAAVDTAHAANQAALALRAALARLDGGR